MNKKEICERLRSKLNIDTFTAYSFIDQLIDALKEGISVHRKITISNFGSFLIVERKEKKTLNPNNKKMMTIPKRKTVKFIPSGHLKKRIL